MIILLITNMILIIMFMATIIIIFALIPISNFIVLIITTINPIMRIMTSFTAFADVFSYTTQPLLLSAHLSLILTCNSENVSQFNFFQIHLLINYISVYRNSIAGSAVCVYNMSALAHAFDGPFKYQQSLEHAWLRHEKPDFYSKVSMLVDRTSTAITDRTINLAVYRTITSHKNRL